MLLSRPVAIHLKRPLSGERPSGDRPYTLAFAMPCKLVDEFPDICGRLLATRRFLYASVEHVKGLFDSAWRSAYDS
jgi:hypothetical protein